MEKVRKPRNKETENGFDRINGIKKIVPAI